eukprot:4753169-Prymnesium_polylepis.1
MDNVRWCVHNKSQQVDLRQDWVVFLPTFPVSPGLPPGTPVPESRAVLAFGLGLQSQSIPVP